MLTITPTAIDAVKVITPKSFDDARGTFCETYNRDRFFEHGIALDFVQDNQSLSLKAGTIRGLHFQSPPVAQAKLVRVLRGSIVDIVVDLRRSSPTYGQWIAERLTASDGKQLFIPAGFAHGYCTREDNTEILYKVTAPYSPTHEHGIAWNDPDLAIDWQSTSEVIVSDKDADLPDFKSLPTYFE